jgi:PhnB protein
LRLPLRWASPIVPSLQYEEEAAMSVSPIPAGYHSITPYLIVDDGEAALRFYAEAFGATEMFRLPMGGRIGHAEMKIGNSIFMLADEWPEMGLLGPNKRGGSSCSLMIYTEDVDASFARAIRSGALEEQPVKDQFYGDRSGTLTDPFGHRWMIATNFEQVSIEEMQRRMAELAEA